MRPLRSSRAWRHRIRHLWFGSIWQQPCSAFESSAWKVAQGLLSHEGDADDHNLPKMIWFGIEGNVESSTEVALDQALLSEIPMVSNFIARRAVAADEVAAVVAAIGRAQNSGQRIPLWKVCGTASLASDIWKRRRDGRQWNRS